MLLATWSFLDNIIQPFHMPRSMLEIHMLSTNEITLNTLGSTSRQILPGPTTSIQFARKLCPYHHHVVYRSLPRKVETYSRTRCTTCKKNLSGRTDHHYCPSPQIIRQHLQEKTGHAHEITPDSVICTTCYKAQMSILQVNASVQTWS